MSDDWRFCPEIGQCISVSSGQHYDGTSPGVGMFHFSKMSGCLERLSRVVVLPDYLVVGALGGMDPESGMCQDEYVSSCRYRLTKWLSGTCKSTHQAQPQIVAQEF